MNEHRYPFSEPGQERRRRLARVKALASQPPGPERARDLAVLTRELHLSREINLALDTARLCLEDTAGDISVLLTVYACHDRDDLLIEDLAMLGNLGRWLDNPTLSQQVRDMAREQAVRWCATPDDRERERRLSTLRRRFDATFADEVAGHLA